MACRYENERLQDKKIEKISKIPGIWLKEKQIQKILKKYNEEDF